MSSNRPSVPAFGTDGVRGVANSELTVEVCVALGRAAAEVLQGGETFLVGRDTRLSGPLLQAALSSGLASVGAKVVDLGVLPTPAIAFHGKVANSPAAVISASHNPFADNGIKFFVSGGKKLDDETEQRIAARMHDWLDGTASNALISGAAVGRMVAATDSGSAYVQHLTDVFGSAFFDSMHVVLDCANGAASTVGPEVFGALGAHVTVLGNLPNGVNINHECGSTHPSELQAVTKASDATIGLALDGDADRVIAVDENGSIVDGDHLIAMLALDAKNAGSLEDDTVVVTVMTNLGFRIAMERAGIHVHETRVGDRYVVEALATNGWSLGGEQSGHVVFSDLTTTGDGLLTGLKVIDLMRRTSLPLSELVARSMTRLPQVLRNVRVEHRGIESSKVVADAVAVMASRLGETGRVLLRASGTEPLVRVMVEAPTQDEAQQVCNELCDVVQEADRVSTA